MRKPLLLLLILLVSSVTSTQCPAQLGSMCTCENLVQGFRVTCSAGGNLNDIVAGLKDDSIDRLDIHNCSPGVKKLVSFPPMKVRVLTISGCGIEKISANAFTNIANGLEELRLMNNLLTSVPILNNLTDLESLNLSNNKVNLYIGLVRT